MFQAENPFVVLGVTNNASIDEITAAWKVKVKQLHPDRYPNSPDEITKKLTEEMSKVNAAYDQLKKDLEGMRQIYSDATGPNYNYESRSDTASRHSRQSTNESRVNLNCEICGSLNTDVFSFTRQVGLVFQRRVGTFEARLCKQCALTLGREYQSRTFTTGWWGAISFFTNFLHIMKNTVGLFRANRLDNPEPPPGYRTTPLDPGVNVAFRPFTWIGPIVIAVLLITSSANSGNSPSNGTNNTPSPGSEINYQWEVGNCVSFGTSVYPLSCNSPHSGKIVAAAYVAESCPIYTDFYVDRNGTIFCIDNNQ